MLIHAAAHSDAFKAIVSEGASGQSIRDDIANAGLVEGILSGSGDHGGDRALHEHAAAPEPEERGREDRADAPVFLVYGENGQGGTEKKPNQALLRRRAASRSRSGRCPNGQHIAGITTEPAEYERRVIGFFDRTLLDPN